MKMDDNAEAAAVAYIQISLKGRARRLKKKYDTLSKKELLVKDTLSYETFLFQFLPNKMLFDDRIVNTTVIKQAMECLTEKEIRILIDYYWKEKKINSLCHDFNVSRNTILKIKRLALGKLRRQLRS